MSNIEPARNRLLRRILEGDGKASRIDRQSAFNNTGLSDPLRQLVDKVALNAGGIGDEDFVKALQSGLTEDQIFEIVVCAAVGQATRQCDAAKAALKAAHEN
jgi:hypothetical protein